MDILDDHSRARVAARVDTGPTAKAAWEAFTHAVADWGIPAHVTNDNGSCFTGRLALNGEADFERMLRSLGVRQICSRPSHTQTCGNSNAPTRQLRPGCASSPGPDHSRSFKPSSIGGASTTTSHARTRHSTARHPVNAGRPAHRSPRRSPARPRCHRCRPGGWRYRRWSSPCYRGWAQHRRSRPSPGVLGVRSPMPSPAPAGSARPAAHPAGQLDTPRAGRRDQIFSQADRSGAAGRCSSCTSIMFVVMRDLLQPTARSRGVTPCHTQNS
jgi:hypothetical protein